MLRKLGLGENSLSKESKYIVSSSDIQEFDYLILIDSRGLVVDDESHKSYVHYLKNKLDYKELTYLIISRPKNLTTFATLYNFLKLLVYTYDGVHYTSEGHEKIYEEIMKELNL